MEHIRGSGIRRVIGHLQDNFDPPTGGDTHGVLETFFIGGNIGSTAILRISPQLTTNFGEMVASIFHISMHHEFH